MMRLTAPTMGSAAAALAVAVLSGCVVQEVPLSAPVEEGTVEPVERDVADMYSGTKDTIDGVMGVADGSGDGVGDWRYDYTSFSGCTPPGGGPGTRFSWAGVAEPQKGTGVPEQTARLVAEHLDTLGVGEVNVGQAGRAWIASTGDPETGAFVRYVETRSPFVDVASACVPGDAESVRRVFSELVDDGVVQPPPVERYIDEIREQQNLDLDGDPDRLRNPERYDDTDTDTEEPAP